MITASCSAFLPLPGRAAAMTGMQAREQQRAKSDDSVEERKRRIMLQSRPSLSGLRTELSDCFWNTSDAHSGFLQPPDITHITETFVDIRRRTATGCEPLWLNVGNEEGKQKEEFCRSDMIWVRAVFIPG